MEDSYEEALARRSGEIMERIEAAARANGRDPGDIRLVAVSKTVGPEELFSAIRVGYRHFAENRPQMLNAKLEALKTRSDLPPVDFDLIGNLQKTRSSAASGSFTPSAHCTSPKPSPPVPCAVRRSFRPRPRRTSCSR